LGEGRKFFWMQAGCLFMVYGALKGMNNCGEIGIKKARRFFLTQEEGEGEERTSGHFPQELWNVQQPIAVDLSIIRRMSISFS
jgi:hypothetical protein